MLPSLRNLGLMSLIPALLIAGVPVHAEDIDIFVGGTGAATSNPNLLFVLDNTGNWSRNDQHWLPKGTTQGQAEVQADRKSVV